MDELGGSGRIHYGHIGLATHDLFGRDRDVTRGNKGLSTDIGNDLHLSMRHGIGMSCQNILDRSRIRAAMCRAHGRAATGKSQS